MTTLTKPISDSVTRPMLHGAQVAFAGPPAIPLVRDELSEKDGEVQRAPEELGRISMGRPLDRA